MTPKEKAEELVDKFKPYVNGYVGSSMLTNTEYPESILRKSKECARIAVDEAISLINRQIEHFVPNFSGGGHTIKMPNQEYQYWQEVKQEIEAL